ncbi:MAG: leucine-rich repeat domain-containing protein, partial [Bacteroidaceae bacterium]|nr:leucine-rich repeat domain-containing protein [Bacteroidaceae bacterium]
MDKKAMNGGYFMKKTLSILLTVITLFTVTLLCTACYSPGSGGLLFTEAKEGYAVTGFSGKERFYKNFTVDIPSEYNGQPVTEIADGAFAGYTSLVRITIPDSVTTINGGAFLGCVLLTEVDIPDSVTFIGDAAFGGCILLEEIHLPDSLTHIDDNVFHDCSSLVNVRIPESVMYIGKDAFAGSDAVAYNEYEDGYYLGNESNPYKALIKVKNTSASDLTMHSGTSVMQKGLIEGCPSLASITFEGNIPAYYDEWGNATYPYSEIPNLTEVTVKAGSIPERAFYGCAKLTNANITDSVESIGSDAFSWCESLSSVTISGSVTDIGDHAFQDCHIKDVYYTGNIGDWCNIRFGIDYANPLYCGANMHIGNELLTELIIPDTVTSI